MTFFVIGKVSVRLGEPDGFFISAGNELSAVFAWGFDLSKRYASAKKKGVYYERKCSYSVIAGGGKR